MATLLLAGVGTAIGGSIGGSFLGVSAALIGQAAGAAIGRSIDAKLLGGSSVTRQEGPRLESLDVMTSQEGASLPEICGRVGVSGQVIWATRMKEVVRVEKEKVGSGKQKQTVKSTFYDYFASFAVSLGEGPVAHFGRVWADGKLLDITDLVRAGAIRFYHGGPDQMPDAYIEAVEGSAPAYRGTAYVVFQDFPLAEYGNRPPQIKVEVFGRSGEMESLVRGVNIIPGSTEWGYMPTVVETVQFSNSGREISARAENANRCAGISDWTLSADMLEAVLPNAETASLVVAWFGTDLRAGRCRIEPRVEYKDKETSPAWSAGGVNRETAVEVSRTFEGRPSYGSAPADASVVAAIRDLRARGKRVILYPFVMMDITDAQALPSPDGNGTQGAYPWRGRIAPTAGQSVAAEVSAFMGGARGFRAFILHLADLAIAAGGVDAILIGSEMRGLTMAQAADGSFPMVDALAGLAADVKARLPSAKVSYAADWSEYHSVRESGDVVFHLDPLWSSPAVDFVGIDNYLPLADWRSTEGHLDLDHAAGITSPYSLEYLKGNIEGGEYWDFYYADDAARVAQIRTPISDGAHGEPWVYRQKAIRDWHGKAHHNRIGGVRDSERTSWVPGSKPVWFTEVGCPAVDVAANQPNVFVARFSSEGSLPYFSAGIRDDYMQRQFLRATLEWWRDNGAGVVAPDDIQVWCWDARPWPEFPTRLGFWSDGTDWRLGHWLNGRAGAAPAREALERRLIERHGLTPAEIDLSECHGQADGFVAEGPMSFRDFLQPFEIGLGVSSREVDGRLEMQSLAHARQVEAVTDADFAAAEGGASDYTATRGAIEDVAAAAILRFRDGIADYQVGAVRASIDGGEERGEAEAQTPLVLDFDRASAAAERILRAAADGREVMSFRLPLSADQVRPGVILPVRLGDLPVRLLQVDRVTRGLDLLVEARSFNRGAYSPSGGVFRPGRSGGAQPARRAVLAILDLPLLPGLPADDVAGYFAATASPWPGRVDVARSEQADGGFFAEVAIEGPATLGETIAGFAPGPAWTWSEGPLDVRLYGGSFVARPSADVLAGANSVAVNHGGEWEVVQFRGAEMIGANDWRLTGLLRGQRGTEALSSAYLNSGAPVVALNGALTPSPLVAAQIGVPFWYRYGPSSVDAASHPVRRHAFRGLGRRPFAPVHLSARIEAGGVRLAWTRRARQAVGTWPASGLDPAVGETAESYQVEIWKAGDLARSVVTAAPSWLYTPAMRSADGTGSGFTARVAQISETFGPGPFASIITKG